MALPSLYWTRVTGRGFGSQEVNSPTKPQVKNTLIGLRKSPYARCEHSAGPAVWIMDPSAGHE